MGLAAASRSTKLLGAARERGSRDNRVKRMAAAAIYFFLFGNPTINKIYLLFRVVRKALLATVRLYICSPLIFIPLTTEIVVGIFHHVFNLWVSY